MVYPALTYLILASAGILGAVVGSFLNVCIYRLPKEYLSIVYPSSHCTFCGTEIRWFDNIPLLSWLWLGGACRYCRSPIRLRYPMVELLTAICFLLCTNFILLKPPLFDALDSDQDERLICEEISRETEDREFLRIDSDRDGKITREEWSRDPYLSAFSQFSLKERWIALCLSLYLVGLLIVITFIDIDYRIIPDRLNYPGLLIAPIFSTLCPIMLRPLPFLENPHLSGFISSLLGMLAGGGSLYLVGVVGKFLFHKEAMGFGDVKMMAMIGGFLGWDAALLIFLAACVVGTVFGVLWMIFTREHYVPFGPYLALGTFLILLFKKEISYLILVAWPDMLMEWVVPYDYFPESY